jgi:hypothetical protein
MKFAGLIPIVMTGTLWAHAIDYGAIGAFLVRQSQSRNSACRWLWLQAELR